MLCRKGIICQIGKGYGLMFPTLKHIGWNVNVRGFHTILKQNNSHDSNQEGLSMELKDTHFNFSEGEIESSSNGSTFTDRRASTTQSQVATSPTLKYLLAIGVDISMLEKYEGAADLVHKLSLTEDIKSFVELCMSMGIDDVAPIINKHPLILGEADDKLRHRIMYLSSRGFSREQLIRIVTKYPAWLCQTVDEIDGKLGAMQLLFQLNMAEMRSLVSQYPRIIDSKPTNLKKVNFSLREEYGLTLEQIKQVIHLSPSVITSSPLALKQRMDFLLDIMKIPKEQIVSFPAVLRHRVKRLKEKHELLKTIGRAQYNPALSGYVSLEDLCADSVLEFSKRHQILKENYHDLLRTM